MDNVEAMKHVSDENRRMFESNGVLINKPFKTSEGRIIVLDKDTGKKVALSSKRDFSPKVHEWIKPKAVEPVEVPEVVTPDSVRYGALKEKGRKN